MKSSLATVIGWVIVALIVFWAFGFIIGTLRWLLRSFLLFALLIGLLLAYFALKDPPKVE
ncbi:MAG TPA: hypothetical protein PK020_23015 [Ilumatobacteraceae bacterium]|nr:hypothetical protein [Ilumatobacteraceae bacterium]HRB05140.1 hypothetical protein [Ilumatobacteraceae bacterium]